LHEISIFVCIYSIIIGFYWGYQVRKAESISTILQNCPFSEDDQEAKYDLIIGTSERGVSHEKISEFPPFQHAMIIFGGLQGLEKAMEQEAHLKNPEQLFQFYINTCPEQGSRTIRTEEAILISLSCLREKLLASAIS
jgi:methyltransferase